MDTPGFELSCPCGKRLQAPARLVGRQVRCPGCKGLLRVPGAHGPPVRTCFVCGQGFPEEIVVCVDCGVDLLEGREIPLGEAAEAAEEARRETRAFWKELPGAVSFVLRPLSLLWLACWVGLFYLLQLRGFGGELLFGVLTFTLFLEQVRAGAHGQLGDGILLPAREDRLEWLLTLVKIGLIAGVAITPYIAYVELFKSLSLSGTWGSAVRSLNIYLPLVFYALYIPLALALLVLFDNPVQALNLALFGRLVWRLPGPWLVLTLVFWAAPGLALLLGALLARIPWVGQPLQLLVGLGGLCISGAVVGIFFRCHRSALQA